MITLKELEFISSWPKYTPFPGTEYAEEALGNLAIAINNYKKYYANKQYNLVLSNSEEITFEILEKNVCHLLGVDFKNLSGEYFDYYRTEVLGFDIGYSPTSFEILNAILDNFDRVIDCDESRGGYCYAINYFRVMIKCAIFDKLSDFSKFNFGVINFDIDTFNNGREDEKKYKGGPEKFLFVQSDEPVAPYFMMGILPNTPFVKAGEQVSTLTEDGTNKIYVPNTLMAPHNNLKNLNNVSEFFKGQEVVIPTQIMIDGNGEWTKVEAKPEEKRALIDQYEAIIGKYGLPNNLNIYGDYKTMLGAVPKKRMLIKPEETQQ